MSSPSLRGLWNECRATMRGLERWRCCMAFFSSAFLAFGLYHVHSVSGITEGGVLGATLLLDHWFSLSPAVSGFVLNLLCSGFIKCVDRLIKYDKVRILHVGCSNSQLLLHTKRIFSVSSLIIRVKTYLMYYLSYMFIINSVLD